MRHLLFSALVTLLPVAALAQTAPAGFPPKPAAPVQTAQAPAIAAQKPSSTVSKPSPAPKLVEPRLSVARSGIAARPRVALTFDACMGQADERILSTLVRERIPATIFVTARWLKKNPQAIQVFLQNLDLFDIENHGQNHIPAVDVPTLIYGIAAAGSPEAVHQEVAGGASAMQAAGFAAPRWFRGSTAKYDASAIRQIRDMGYRIAGYSLNGDDGSLLGAGAAERKISAAKDGDVVIAHINQPTHAAGEGVARALLALKKRGVEFVRLSDVEGLGDDGTSQ